MAYRSVGEMVDLIAVQYIVTPALQYFSFLRRGARVVDWARLESVFALTGNGGSNPPPSASSNEENT